MQSMPLMYIFLTTPPPPPLLLPCRHGTPLNKTPPPEQQGRLPQQSYLVYRLIPIWYIPAPRGGNRGQGGVRSPHSHHHDHDHDHDLLVQAQAQDRGGGKGGQGHGPPPPQRALHAAGVDPRGADGSGDRGERGGEAADGGAVD